MGTVVAAAKRGSSLSSQPFALPWSPLLAVTALLMIVIGNEVAAGSVYPGVIELVGYSNRRARTHYSPTQVGAATADAATVSPPPAKIQADIETVKQNIEKYNKLLTLDTRNLPDSQKDMLERIVERVARLKESLDINNDKMLRSQDFDARQTDYLPTTELSTRPMLTETETDPTLILDETTLLQLQTSMDELAAAHASVTAQATRIRETTAIPTTDANLTGSDSDETATASNENAAGITQANNEYPLDATTMDPINEKEATESDSQFVAARSNNHNSIAAITAADIDNETSDSEPGTTVNGSQRTLTTSGKLSKTRATKRPGSGTKVTVTSSQTIRQRPPVGSSAAGLHKHTVTGSSSTTSTKHKHTTQGYTTTQPQQQYHNTKQKIKPQVQAQPQSQTQYYQQKQPATVDKVSAASQTPSSAATLPASSGLTTTPGAAVRNPSYATGNISDAAPTTDLYNANTHTNNNNDMVYDPQVNTSAIIDSLNNAREEYYQQKQTINGNINGNINKDKKPSSATAKPTKYHYYPHNQHIYLLPECAIQQVCNAVYVRLNYTQPLCACPSRYRDPCSASLNEDDQHTTKLVGDGKKKAITLAKTCEATTEMRECRSPKDWSLLALQNTRTGKSHYLVICRCPDHFKMEGPMAHDQPTYASVPGIRVFGMMCVKPGYSVRKPSAQPPKRYQLQKPIYRPGNSGGSTGGLVQNSYINNNQYVSGGASSSNKDVYGRPTSTLTSSSSNAYHPVDVFQSQHQANYQYLNRPDSVVSIGSYRPDSSQLSPAINNNFPTTIYGRNNERKGDAPIEAVTEEDTRESMKSVATNAPATGDELAPQKRTTSGERADDFSAAASTLAAAVGGADEEHGELGETTMPETKREKRSATMAEPMQFNEFNDDTPAFPWDRVIEFHQSIVWD